MLSLGPPFDGIPAGGFGVATAAAHPQPQTPQQFQPSLVLSLWTAIPFKKPCPYAAAFPLLHLPLEVLFGCGPAALGDPSLARWSGCFQIRTIPFSMAA